jgi:transposase
VSELKRRLEKAYPNATFVGVYEAGFSGYVLAREARELGMTISPIHAADVPLTDKDRQQKTDAIDAMRLAKMARVNTYESIYIPTPFEEYLRQLVRRRSDLVKSRTRVVNKIKSHLAFTGTLTGDLRYSDWHMSAKRVAYLEGLARERRDGISYDDLVLLGQLEEYKGYNKRVLRLTREIAGILNDQRTALYGRLLDCPGIGPVTAMTLIGEVFNMERFTSFDKLCSYVGLMPRTHSSGERDQRGRMVSRGNKRLRCALIEAAWRAKSVDPALQLYYYEQVTQAKMKPNLAIIKVATKLLCRIRHVWISGESYRIGVN